MTVFDLEEAELAYAPQFGSAKDPINMAGFIAANVVRGDVRIVQADQLPQVTSDDATLVDVRTPAEFARGHFLARSTFRSTSCESDSMKSKRANPSSPTVSSASEATWPRES